MDVCDHPLCTTHKLPNGEALHRCLKCGLTLTIPSNNKTTAISKVESVFGVNLDHIRLDMLNDNTSNSLEHLAQLKAKMAAVEKNPSLSKYLPKKFLGAGGQDFDKYGNVVPEPPPLKKPFLVMKPAYYKPFKVQPKYDINKDQLLIARIGMASNLNVSIQQAFYSSSYRVLCRHCGADKVYFDTNVFLGSEEGLHDDVMDFCTAHRHTTETKLQMGFKALPALVETEGRRFREED